jgi:hypothetical protein
MGKFPSIGLALVGVMTLLLATSAARGSPGQPGEPITPLLREQSAPPAVKPAAILPCPPGAPEPCRLLPGTGLETTLSVRASQPFSRLPPSAIGIEAAIGAGVTGFLTQRARAFANPGGAWEVRVTLGSRLPFAFEGAYIGSRQSLAMLGLERNGFVLGNGAEGTLRFNVTRTLIQPYLFVGTGWTKYQLRDTKVRTRDGGTSDDVFQVPFGAGVAMRAHHAFVDVRGTGRLMYNDTLIDQVGGSSPIGAGPLSSWSCTGRVGWEF